MKIEISAGGVVVRYRYKRWEVLLLRDMNKQWTFPKGLIEKGEDKVDAARREIMEEVGVSDLVYKDSLGSVRFTFKRKGLVSKTVYYHLFQCVENPKLIPQREEGITAVAWVKLTDAMDKVGYPETNKKLLEKAEKVLNE